MGILSINQNHKSREVAGDKRKDNMDMYYFLKDKLTCQDCKHPLKYTGKNGYESYTAICVSCGEEVEIKIEVSPLEGKKQ